MKLSELKPGQRGRVTGWDGPAPIRVMEMGVLVGTELTVSRFAPLGDPIDLKVRDYHLSIRKEEAHKIVIEPLK
ncbi:MAG: ferrous iron transport protein A [Chrysiogenetes bacterium]|nr:ferrous iron transport protein A [Chrysiogenetes bacterium]